MIFVQTGLTARARFVARDDSARYTRYTNADGRQRRRKPVAEGGQGRQVRARLTYGDVRPFGSTTLAAAVLAGTETAIAASCYFPRVMGSTRRIAVVRCIQAPCISV
jgi:hypothetical protein